MFEEADLDDRERQIMATADSYWAMRFMGAGNYDRLGPYESLEQVVLQVQAFFRHEDSSGLCPPPSSITKRPFLIYASASSYSNAQVVAGTVYRDGVVRPTYAQYQRRRKEEKASAAKQRTRDRRNAARAPEV